MDRKDRHKKVRCLACGKCMQSNNLKRHSKIHKDIMSMNEDEVREELQARHAKTTENEERRPTIEEIAYKEGIPLPQDIIETSF